MSEFVAVTGAEGFIGSHLVERLVRHGQRVRAMVLYNSFDSRGWLDTLPADVLAEVEVLPGDVRDPASAHDLVRGTSHRVVPVHNSPYCFTPQESPASRDIALPRLPCTSIVTVTQIRPDPCSSWLHFRDMTEPRRPCLRGLLFA